MMPTYDNQNLSLLIGLSTAAGFLSLVIFFLYRLFRNPFHYPYFEQTFDVTGKRNVDIHHYIDTFLCNKDNWQTIIKHKRKIQQWKIDTLTSIENSKLKKYRLRQFQSIQDEANTYRFVLTKKQTRYRQRNYVKTSYKVTIVHSEWATNWNYLVNRYTQLATISFEATLQEYNSKSQRKLMTKALRDEIKIRDNYTCQRCGKYMPDEVGLHIDHIVPIAKGGKSVRSNLQVLCSKCNGSKGSKSC